MQQTVLLAQSHFHVAKVVEEERLQCVEQKDPNKNVRLNKTPINLSAHLPVFPQSLTLTCKNLTTIFPMGSLTALFPIIFLIFFTFVLPCLLGSSSLSYFVLLLNSLVVCMVSLVSFFSFIVHFIRAVTG